MNRVPAAAVRNLSGVIDVSRSNSVIANTSRLLSALAQAEAGKLKEHKLIHLP